MNILELLYQKYPKCFTDIYIDAFVKYSTEFPEFFKNIKQKSLYLCLMGPPGTGKSTIGAKLSKLLNIPHISTGNLCRKIMNSENNEQSETLKSYINSGLLVPPSIIHSIYEERIKDDDCKNGFILDGYPYKENIDYILENNIQMPIFDVIVLNCDKTTSVLRQTLRNERVTDTMEKAIIRYDEYHNQFPNIDEIKKEFMKLNSRIHSFDTVFSEDLEEKIKNVIKELTLF